MKASCSVFIVGALVVSAAQLKDAHGGRDGIADVVAKLQVMQTRSQAEWEIDKTNFELFVVYCDQNTAAKKTAIADATTSISLLSNRIDEAQGSTGKLSIECSGLKADMAVNEQAREEARLLRAKENSAFVAEKRDLEEGEGQMSNAIQKFGEIGADQTSANRDKADHSKFMGGYKTVSLVGVHSKIRQALLAAQSFLGPEEQQKVTALVQGPFTGTYSTQSGQIIGILKDMKETFASNMATASANENASLQAYNKFKKNKKKDHNAMVTSYDEKQTSLGLNDGVLSTKKGQLQETKRQQGEDEQFLTSLTQQCKDKAEEYKVRKVFAANEAIALQKAVSILDNTVAKAKFAADHGGAGPSPSPSTQPWGPNSPWQDNPDPCVADDCFWDHFQDEKDATDAWRERGRAPWEGGLSPSPSGYIAPPTLAPAAETFIQLSARPGTQRSDAVALLQNTKGAQSPRVRQVLLLLQAGNPFAVVLDKIDQLIKLSGKEQIADDGQKAYCQKTNTANSRRLDESSNDLTAALQSIDDLKILINDPVEGLKYSFQETESSLTLNLENQGQQTETRRAANLEYQKDASSLKDAIETIAKADDVLKAYYESLDNEELGLIQIHSRTAQAPTTFTGSYKGQNEQAKTILGLLATIAGETRDEVTAEHDAELTSQHAYEDSMASLKEGEAEAQRTIIELTKQLATAEKELDGEYTEQAAQQKQHTGIERYILKMKPGCDFVLNKHEERQESRNNEIAALNGALETLRSSPAFQDAEERAYDEKWGDCKTYCLEDSRHVKCKACMAKVTIPAYCAGHKGTTGC